MLTVSAAARHDLSDAQWALLEPLLPPTAPCGRPRRWPIRGLVDGVRHRARAGCPWRDVPVRYGPWWRVYALFACWQLLGVWARVEAALRQAADRNGRLSWQVSVDSTTARAHIHAAGARRDSVNRVAGEPDHHALGRSRGGWGTKTHAAIDQHRGLPRSCSPRARTATARSSSPCSSRSGSPDPGPADHGNDPTVSWRTRLTPPARTGPGCASAKSQRRSRSRPTSKVTGSAADPPAGVHPRSTPSGTRTATPSRPGSTTSSTIARSPPGTTSSPSATPPASLDHWLRRLS